MAKSSTAETDGSISSGLVVHSTGFGEQTATNGSGGTIVIIVTTSVVVVVANRPQSD